MFKGFPYVVVGMALLGFAAQTFAATDKDPCPPIVPKADMTYMKKIKAAMNLKSDAAKRAALKKLQNTYSREIKTPRTWSGCHTIRDTLTIDAPVTVSAGSMLKFKANAGLQVGHNGSLNATGTADDPVTFTATDETPGYWYGLFFDSKSSHNRLSHVKVLYAGGTKVGRGRTLPRPGGDTELASTAILVKKGALLTVQHSVIAHSGGYGIESQGKLGTIVGNHIKHTKIPMRVRPDNIGHIAVSNTFADNGKQQINIIVNESVTQDSTWRDLGIPYNLPLGTNVAANLVVEPGVVLVMGDGANVYVDHGGALNAVGTAGKPIVIRGESNKAGYWGKVWFSSASAKNVLSYVKLSGGGSDDAEVSIGPQASASVTHSVIADSAGYGVEVEGTLQKFADNRVERTHVPMRVEQDGVGVIAASNRFSDNDKQQIEVKSSGNPVSDATWHDVGVPYSLRYGMDIAGDLELEPGVSLILGQGADIDVRSDASLKAVGTADKPIVIRGRSAKPGYWDGLDISSHSKKNVFRHVKLSDGGGGSPNYAIIEDLGYLKIEHSRIENSKKIGIWVADYPSPNAVLDASDNTFKKVEIPVKRVQR